MNLLNYRENNVYVKKDTINTKISALNVKKIKNLMVIFANAKVDLNWRKENVNSAKLVTIRKLLIMNNVSNVKKT